MPATVTNKALHTGTMTNKGSSDSWDSSVITWADSGRLWATTAVSNKSLHTGTMTNKSIH